jgi:hypothetical protein
MIKAQNASKARLRRGGSLDLAALDSEIFEDWYL